MTSLFDPMKLHRHESTTEFAVHLSALEPYLADHCPGAFPLFGTAMSLEAVATAAAKCSAQRLTEIRNVRVGRALVVTTPATRVLIRVSSQPSGELHGVLYSQDADGEDVVHLQSDFGGSATYDEISFPNRVVDRNASGRLPVSGAQVYELLFHGPSFRVIGSCGWRDDVLCARLASPLPTLTRGGQQRTTIAPMLLEFALQSAGIWEVALSARIMIPSGIDRIILGRPGYEAAGTCTANARRGAGGAIDIDVTDLQGNRVMNVIGYQTVPLPFPSNETSLARLAGTLRTNSEICKA
jgi:hypothetical protein